MQSCPPTPGQPVKEPFVIPVSIGLLGADGRELPLQLEGEAERHAGHAHAGADARRRAVHLRRRRRRAGAVDAARLLRAGDPRLRLQRRRSCSRCWPTTPTRSTAGKPASAWRCAPRCRAIAAPAGTGDRRSTTPSSTRCAACCATRSSTPAFKELVLTLPSETYIAEQLDVVDPQRVHAVREAMRAQLATALRRRLGAGLRAEPRHRRLHARPGLARAAARWPAWR